jgi:hypothetical protein
MAYVDLKNRVPKTEYLDDARLRVTDVYDLIPLAACTPAQLQAEVWLDRGAAHDKFTNCRLIKQWVDGQATAGEDPKQPPTYKPAKLTRVFEQIAATGETCVGNSEIKRSQGGLNTVVDTYYQFSSDTATPQTPGSTTAASPNTDCVLKLEEVEDKGTIRIITRTYINLGVISRKKNGRSDGLIEETVVSVTTRTAPNGAIILDESRIVGQGRGVEADTIVYTVSAVQSYNGSDPTHATLTQHTTAQFTHPGRAKTYVKTISVGGLTPYPIIDVFLSPPIQLTLQAEVNISYQTNNNIGDTGTWWQPTSWATMQADWHGIGVPTNPPRSVVQALREYRSVSDTPITVQAVDGPNGESGSCMGNTMYGASYATVTCSGGPADPTRHTYTVHASLEAVFTTTEGITYYRKTVTTVTVPALDNLPV